MKNSHMKATTLRVLMISITVIVISLSVAGFYFMHSWLKEYSTTSNTNTASANVDKSTASTAKIESEIAKYQMISDKANSVFSLPAIYKEQALNDLRQYASVYGLSISSNNLNQTGNSANQNTITITLSNPVQFTKLVKFVKAIETNSPKMQITKMDISSINGSKGSVKVEPITIEVYTK